MLAIENILQQLQAHSTEDILVASQQPLEAIRQFAGTHHRHVTEITPANQHCASLPHRAFAVVIDYLEHLDRDTALHQLGLWRNLHCNHMWIGITANHGLWTFQDFISLGCKRLGQFEWLTSDHSSNHPLNEGDGVTGATLIDAYGYDLGHYNQQRRWNNPRYWANPDMWPKRW